MWFFYYFIDEAGIFLLFLVLIKAMISDKEDIGPESLCLRRILKKTIYMVRSIILESWAITS